MKKTKMKRSEVSFSERRLRQVRMAAAVFGRSWQVAYPATREGFKAFWRHARIRARIVYDVQWKRALPEARFEGNSFRPQRDLSGKARVGYVYPDRVWVFLVSGGFEEWSFRYHLLREAAYKVLRNPDGTFNARKHHNACWKLMRYHAGPGEWGDRRCLYCRPVVQSRVVTTKDKWGHTRIVGGHGE